MFEVEKWYLIRSITKWITIYQRLTFYSHVLVFLKFPIHFCFCKMHHCVFRIKDASEIIRVINSFQMRSLKNLASDFAHFLIMMATSSFQAQSSWYITISVATCSVSVKIFFVSQIFDNDHIFFKHSYITLFILFGAGRSWYFQSGLYVIFFYDVQCSTLDLKKMFL